MITPRKLRLVAEIISEMANIPPGVRDPLAEAADAWEADIAEAAWLIDNADCFEGASMSKMEEWVRRRKAWAALHGEEA